MTAKLYLAVNLLALDGRVGGNLLLNWVNRKSEKVTSHLFVEINDKCQKFLSKQNHGVILGMISKLRREEFFEELFAATSISARCCSRSNFYFNPVWSLRGFEFSGFEAEYDGCYDAVSK